MATHKSLQERKTVAFSGPRRISDGYLWGLAALSAALLSLPFLVPGTAWLACVGFVPLLAAEYLAGEARKKHFWLVYYGCFLLWNTATTYWIYKATAGGAAAAIILNALQMAVVFRLFRWMRSLTGGFLPYLFFIVTWMAWENAYYTWDVSWPWLVLGNAFAASVKTVQWYEYTGVLGGTLWILLINTLLFRILLLKKRGERIRVSVISLVCLVAFPTAFSHLLFARYEEKPFEPSAALAGTPEAGSRMFTVLQPNIDPYSDKFGGLSPQQQDAILLEEAEKALAAADREKHAPDSPAASLAPAHLLVAPETFISPPPYWNMRLDERNPSANASFTLMQDWIRNRNALSGNLHLIVGAVTTEVYEPPYRKDASGKTIPPSGTANEFRSAGLWYDRFNTAVFLNGNGEHDFYHKSKLVVIVESTPYKRFFNFMSRFAIDLGGNMGHFGTQERRTVFTTPDSVKIGTAICYEAIYGDFYREYVLNGAQVMAVISNDGWWGDTPGYRQLLRYSALRAIETRRSIARSANTGISAFIDQRGVITAQTGWWQRGYLNGRLNLNDRMTVFVAYGDIAGRMARFLFFLFSLMGIVRSISRRYMTRP